MSSTSTAYTVCVHCEKINRVPLRSPSGKTPVCGSCKQTLPIHEGVSELSASQLAVLARKSPLPIAVDFWAPWCGPCRSFAPIFQQTASQLGDQFIFVKVNTEAHPLAGDLYRIRSIPTLLVLQNGAEIARQSGAMSLPMFQQWLIGARRAA